MLRPDQTACKRFKGAIEVVELRPISRPRSPISAGLASPLQDACLALISNDRHAHRLARKIVPGAHGMFAPPSRPTFRTVIGVGSDCGPAQALTVAEALVGGQRPMVQYPCAL